VARRTKSMRFFLPVTLPNIHVKKIENRLSVDRIMAMSLWSHFFGPLCTVQSTTVHDGLLHPNLRYCSSPASAVRRLPSAVRNATSAFDVRSSGLFLWPARRLGTRYQTTCEIRHVPFTVSPGAENFSFLVLLPYRAH